MQALRTIQQRRVPDLDPVRERRRGCRDHPIDIDSIENTERAQNLLHHEVAGANYYHREDNPPYWGRAPGAISELYVREGLLWRLHKVNKQLHTWGLELYVFDAYRPVEVQNYFHDKWVPTYLHEKYPEWSDEEIAYETGEYWAKGAPSKDEIDPMSPPPHATGGVIDCTIRNRHTGEHLYMGTQFDEVHESAHTDYFEKKERVLTISEETARDNRRLLYWVMQEVGMVNNPNEWWHFSYGDQMWAKILAKPNALYSVLNVS
jgi:D-alanyl-D-alanine dipeptidase